MGLPHGRRFIGPAVLSFITLLACASCATSAAPRSKAYPREERLVAAVLDMENRAGIEDADGVIPIATNQLIDELLAGERLRIVEREKLDALIEELQLGSSGLVDEEQAEKIGNLLGVDALLFPVLESVKTDDKTRSALIAKNSRRSVEITLTARLVHVGSGEILASAEASSRVTQRVSSAFGVFKSGGISALDAAIREALEDAVPRLAGELVPRIPRKES